MKKTRKKPTFKKNSLFIPYKEVRDGGHPINPEDSWPDYTPIDVDFHIIGVRKERPDTFYVEEICDVEFSVRRGTRVYIVVVRYRTGWTFGHTNGAWFVERVTNNSKQAHDTAELIRGGKYEGYKPWEGYFEALQDVYVEEFTIE